MMYYIQSYSNKNMIKQGNNNLNPTITVTLSCSTWAVFQRACRWWRAWLRLSLHRLRGAGGHDGSGQSPPLLCSPFLPNTGGRSRSPLERDGRPSAWPWRPAWSHHYPSHTDLEEKRRGWKMYAHLHISLMPARQIHVGSKRSSLKANTHWLMRLMHTHA